jgi:hypothetical protein
MKLTATSARWLWRIVVNPPPFPLVSDSCRLGCVQLAQHVIDETRVGEKRSPFRLRKNGESKRARFRVGHSLTKQDDHAVLDGDLAEKFRIVRVCFLIFPSCLAKIKPHFHRLGCSGDQGGYAPRSPMQLKPVDDARERVCYIRHKYLSAAAYSSASLTNELGRPLAFLNQLFAICREVYVRFACATIPSWSHAR